MKKIRLQKFITKISKKIDFPQLLSKSQELITEITQNKNKLTTAIIIILIILYLDFSFVLRSQMRALGAIKPRIVRISKDLKNLNADLIRMQTQEGGLGITQMKRIVSTDEVPWIIEEISRLANQHEIRISTIKPSRRQSEKKDSQKFALPEKYSLVLIDLEASGSYHQLGRLLTELENHAVYMNIEELDIRQRDKSPFEHKIKLKLNTYVSDE